MTPLKTISLFCGCGGADLGLLGNFQYLGNYYTKNPIDIIHASDIDQKAVDTYNANFEHQAICQDVREIVFKEAADLVIGGFPCQNFSTVNPLKDPENKDHQLFWELARVVKETNPKYFIGENVKGFANLKKGKYISMALEAFEALGYRVFWKILNSSHYGVPQLRERVFLVGIREDIAESAMPFEFPVATHGEGLAPIVPIQAVKFDDETIGEKYYFSQRAVEGVKRAKPNMKRALAQDINGPCLTITSHLAKVSLNSRDPVLLVDPQNERYRRFSPREAARIQSFPDSYELHKSQFSAYKQIGNAVPPVVMWHIIQSLLRFHCDSQQLIIESTK